MLFATLTCVALKTPVYWLYEQGWDMAFHHNKPVAGCTCGVAGKQIIEPKGPGPYLSAAQS